MASRPRPTYSPAYADSLKLYDTFSLYRDGRDALRVISSPERHKNLVGERTYVVMTVTRDGPHERGEMILCPHNTVYIKNKKD